MIRLAPSWALSGQALDGSADPHLTKGYQVRLATNPMLGLPVAPIVVRRIVLDASDRKELGETDVRWVDANGTVLNEPFTVTPDNPVTGFFATGARCCWARVLHRTREQDAGLRLEGLVVTSLGDAPVAIQSGPVLDVYASHLDRLRISGSGVVVGVQWLDAQALNDASDNLAMILTLPVKPGRRYAGTGDGFPAGLDRATRGAPQRFGMHESPTAGGPAGCPAAAPSDETKRIDNLAPSLLPSLDRLVDDLSAPQTELTSPEPVIDARGVQIGTSDRLLLDEVLSCVVDPGLARWLGFMDLDPDLRDPDTVVVYQVNAMFAPDWGLIDKQELRSTLPPLIPPAADAIRQLVQFDGQLPDLEAAAAGLETSDHLVVGVMLTASTGVPLDAPADPALSVTSSAGWQPGTAPTARREVVAALERLVPAAGLASAMAQPDGSTPVERNPLDAIGRRRLLTADLPEAAVSATAGELRDRSPDDRDGRWQLAQLDWFGRWSGWTRRGLGAGVRPGPPRPVLVLTTQAPVVPTPVPTGPLSGTVRIDVAVPAVSALPPGGRLLAILELAVVTSGVPVVSTHPVADPSNPAPSLVVEVLGPALTPTASGSVTVTARWLDSAGVASEPSAPRTATLHDPRAPGAVVLPPTLTYTARPDATGRAEATLEWSTTPDQAFFRVFLADETTLRAKLTDIAAGRPAPGDAGEAPSVAQATAFLASLDAAGSDEPARGAVWDALRARLPRRWFRQLTGEPLPRTEVGSTRFTHGLSGSLAVLALFRVVAVSAASVESDFRTSPMLPRRVPNALSPSVPAATVTVVASAGALHARLDVDVPVGPTPVTRYRIRRATTTTEPALMPIVAEGIVTPGSDADGRQRFAVLDTGSGPAGPRTSLPAWMRYHWRVEVQGAPAPGGGPPGAWSRPSPAVSTVTTPPAAPAGVEAVTAAVEADAVHVRFTQPEPLAGGATTGYRVDVYRRLPGGLLRLLTSLPGQEPPPRGRGDDVTGSFDVVDADPGAGPGTAYRVQVVDPIGRTSPASEPVILP